MGRARTATALLEARGAFKNHPERKRQDPEVKSDFPGIAPANLTPLQLRAWGYIVNQIPASVLTGADQASVQLLCVLWAEFQQDTASFPSAKIGQMRGLMGEFGMSPAARAKLATRPEDDDGDF